MQCYTTSNIWSDYPEEEQDDTYVIENGSFNGFNGHIPGYFRSSGSYSPEPELGYAPVNFPYSYPPPSKSSGDIQDDDDTLAPAAVASIHNPALESSAFTGSQLDNELAGEKSDDVAADRPQHLTASK